MSEKLISCPFCDGETAPVVRPDGKYRFVLCTWCGARGATRISRAKAISDWNSRTREDAIRASAEQAEAELAKIDAFSDYMDEKITEKIRAGCPEMAAALDKALAELAALKERDKSLRLELHTLRFKESQEQRFIWWVWNVYAKNVQELLIQTRKVLLIHSDAFWSLVRNLTDYTERIYDGTYLDVQISTDAKTLSDNNKPPEEE